jgi:hypothetical protein
MKNKEFDGFEDLKLDISECISGGGEVATTYSTCDDKVGNDLYDGYTIVYFI